MSFGKRGKETTVPVQPRNHSAHSVKKTRRSILCVVLIVLLSVSCAAPAAFAIDLFQKGFEEAVSQDPAVRDALGSCFYGALYQNGNLTYGMTRLYMPGYSLLPGEGDSTDWLMTPDGTSIFCAYKNMEMSVSYDASDEAGMLSSYKQSYSDASMVSFQKYYAGQFPVIRYIVRYTSEGIDQYQGELIVFPAETANDTIRLSMFTLAEAGYDEINRVFDTLSVSTDFALKSADTGVMGLNRITVK